MREIKFRAWANGNMIEWEQLKLLHNGMRIAAPPKLPKMVDVHPMDMPYYLDFVAINPGNIFDNGHLKLMQYTCLKDKNGKEIYEGDIVKATKWKPQIYKIDFLEGGFCAVQSNCNYNTDINHFYDSTGCMFEVIGNIYENSDLLK